MAYVKCSGGGKLRDYELWSNPVTKNGTNFGAQNITLSDNIENYEYLKIYHRGSSNSSTSAYGPLQTSFLSNIVIVEEFLSTISQSSNCMNYCISCTFGSAGRMARLFYCVNNTTIHFNNASRISYAANGNDFVIPMKIYGMK